MFSHTLLTVLVALLMYLKKTFFLSEKYVLFLCVTFMRFYTCCSWSDKMFYRDVQRGAALNWQNLCAHPHPVTFWSHLTYLKSLQRSLSISLSQLTSGLPACIGASTMTTSSIQSILRFPPQDIYTRRKLLSIVASVFDPMAMGLQGRISLHLF